MDLGVHEAVIACAHHATWALAVDKWHDHRAETVVFADAILEGGNIERKQGLTGTVVFRHTNLCDCILHGVAAGAKTTTTDGIYAGGTARTFFEPLALAAPAIQIRAAGTLTSLGQILEQSKAGDTALLLATAATAGQDTADCFSTRRNLLSRITRFSGQGRRTGLGLCGALL